MPDLESHPAIPNASTRHKRGISIVWLIPLVAVAIGGWLAWDTFSKQGPTITVSFESAEGLQAGQSQLKFKDIVLGTVRSLELTPDHKRVNVVISTTRQAEPLFTESAQFWVVKPRLFAGNISGLNTLLSGAYVSLTPGQADKQPRKQFVGREDPPVLESNVAGHTFLVKASRVGSVSVGSPVFFRDLTVGTVLGWDIGDMVRDVTIHVFVQAPYDTYVHDETRFWDASGLGIKLGGNGVEVQLESVRALLLGGIAFETPSAAQGSQVSDENHVFPLFADRDSANAASYTRQVPLLSYFSGSVRGLAPGSEVTVHGLTVGHVKSVGLVYDPATKAIRAPVRYDVQPERVIGVGNHAFKTTAEGVDALVKQGLRAALESTNLITGQQVVALDFVPNAPAAAVKMEGSDFVLPTAEGSGLAGLQASATALLSKVNQIPFDQLGENLNSILQSVSDAANGPQVKQALNDLASTLNSVKGVASHLDSGLTPTLRQLPDLLFNLQRTMTNVNALAQSINTGYGGNTKFNRDVERLLAQLNETLSSFRSLADLLQQHPDALIKGRPGGGLQ
jgi:paraquat-inducible protein B